MATTIQISEKLQAELTKKKLSERETYEEIIWDMLEDSMEISEQTKKELEAARAEIKAGKFYTHAQTKKQLGL